MEFKIYKNGVSIWKHQGADFIGIDLDDGEQIRIKDEFLQQVIETMKAIEIIEAKKEEVNA